MSINHVVAGNVRAEMARKGAWTQGLLAEAIGFSRESLRRRLNGDVSFRIDELQIIACCLGVPLSVLIDSPESVAQ
jgi:transcriptional regulator with XRE-family HTH domain